MVSFSPRLNSKQEGVDGMFDDDVVGIETLRSDAYGAHGHDMNFYDAGRGLLTFPAPLQGPSGFPSLPDGFGVTQRFFLAQPDLILRSGLITTS